MNMSCYYLKIDYDKLFKNRPERPAFVLRPLKSLINFEVDRLSLLKLEYEMDCTDYPVHYNFFEIGYCGHPNFPSANIQFKQANNLTISHFQEEDHPFIHDAPKKRHNWFHYILFTDLRKCVQNGYNE